MHCCLDAEFWSFLPVIAQARRNHLFCVDARVAAECLYPRGCHPEVPVKLARVLKPGSPTRGGSCFGAWWGGRQRANRGEGSAPPKARVRHAAVNYSRSIISQDLETECARPISLTSCPTSRAGSTWARPASYKSGSLSTGRAGTKAHLPHATALTCWSTTKPTRIPVMPLHERKSSKAGGGRRSCVWCLRPIRTGRI